MKLFLDFFPIICFFIAYKFAGIYVATGVAIGASLIQVSWQRIKHRRWDGMQLLALALILILGGATLWSHDEWFIKWKPTIVNWILALIFAGSQLFYGKPFAQQIMQTQIQLPQHIWQRLNYAWIIFFLITGLVNLYVIYHYSTNAWVNFKLFGMLGLTTIFVLLQAVYIMRYAQPLHEN